MSAQPEKVDGWIWRIALIVTVGGVMVGLDSTIVNVALTDLGRELNATVSQTQWVITAYLLALAAVIPVAGWAGRRWGPKRVYLVSLVLFTGGSVLCGISTSIEELTAFRVIQGIGGGMLLPIGQLMLASAAGPRRMGRVMSFTSAPLMLMPLIGPAIGGIVIEALNWRWMFFINVPVGIIAFIIAVRGLPESERKPAGPLDVIGLALLATGMPAITYGLAEIGSTGGISSPQVYVPFLAGLALCGAFGYHALHTERPLLDLRLYRHKTFTAASLTTFCLAGGMFGQQILAPLYYQQVRGLDVLATGLLVGFPGISAALTMVVAGRMTDRHGAGRLALLGVTCAMCATLPLTFIGAHTPYWLISAALLLRGFGGGFGFVPTMAVALSSVSREELPDATPQMNVLQRLGGSAGVAIIAVVLERAIVAAGPHPTQEQLAAAFGVGFWSAFVLQALAVIPVVVLIRTERRVGRRRAGGTPPAPEAPAREPAALEPAAVEIV